MNADQGRAIQQVDTGWTVTLIEADTATPPWIPRTPIAATVPGCVHTDLLAAGHIADPFHASVEHEPALDRPVEVAIRDHLPRLATPGHL